MNIDRRRMLQGLGSLGGLSLLSPAALGQVRLAGPPLLGEVDGSQPILVMLELAGGNDGLSTVVPYGDDAYGRARKATRIGQGGSGNIPGPTEKVM